MTTDETRDQSGNTPEKIAAEALQANWGSYSASERGSMPSEEEDARIVVAALRAAGLLVEGAPTDEQVRAGAHALDEAAMDAPQDYPLAYELAMQMSRDVLAAAAGVAQPAPSESGLTPAEIASRSGDGSCSNPQCPLTRAHSGPCAPPPPGVYEHGVLDRGELLARLMDTLAYYHCRSTNPKADHPSMGYHAFSEDQREFLREKQREAAEEVLRMWNAETRPAPNHARLIGELRSAPIKGFAWRRLLDRAADALAAPAPVHIAEEAVQKLRGLGLNDTAIRERLAQATMLAAADASDEFVQVVAKIAAKATITSEDLHQLEHRGTLVKLDRGPGPVDERDRAMLIAQTIARAHTFTTTTALSIADVAVKLAAPADEAKIAEAIEQHREVYVPRKGDSGCRCGWRRSNGDDNHTSHQARAVRERLQGVGGGAR